MTAAVLLPEPPAVGRTNVQTRKPPFSKSPLFIPALFLLLVGVIGSLVNLAMAMQWFISPEGTIENRTIYINSIGSKLGKELNGDELNEGLKILRTVETIVGFASLLPILGALAMIRLRFRWLAILGSLVAMINPGSLCCLLGFPTGCYAIIKLLDPDISVFFKLD